MWIYRILLMVGQWFRMLFDYDLLFVMEIVECACGCQEKCLLKRVYKRWCNAVICFLCYCVLLCDWIQESGAISVSFIVVDTSAVRRLVGTQIQHGSRHQHGNVYLLLISARTKISCANIVASKVHSFNDRNPIGIWYYSLTAPQSWPFY